MEMHRMWKIDADIRLFAGCKNSIRMFALWLIGQFPDELAVGRISLDMDETWISCGK